MLAVLAAENFGLAVKDVGQVIGGHGESEMAAGLALPQYSDGAGLRKGPVCPWRLVELLARAAVASYHDRLTNWNLDKMVRNRCWAALANSFLEVLVVIGTGHRDSAVGLQSYDAGQVKIQLETGFVVAAVAVVELAAGE